jgi:hypothetical protein
VFQVNAACGQAADMDISAEIKTTSANVRSTLAVVHMAVLQICHLQGTLDPIGVGAV